MTFGNTFKRVLKYSKMAALIFQQTRVCPNTQQLCKHLEAKCPVDGTIVNTAVTVFADDCGASPRLSRIGFETALVCGPYGTCVNITAPAAQHLSCVVQTKVVPTGLEPVTFRLLAERSNQLS